MMTKNVKMFDELMKRLEMLEKSDELLLPLGFGADGLVVAPSLDSIQNLLVAGMSGRGKTNLLHCLIAGLTRQSEPERLQLILVDCQCLDLDAYDGLPLLRGPVLQHEQTCRREFARLLKESKRRCRLLKRAGVKTVEEYNAQVAPKKALPRIVVMVDELADMIAVHFDRMEKLIVQVGKKTATTGIHMVLCTSRSDVRVLTGVIKSVCPARIAFRTKRSVESRCILDQTGAEELEGYGEMLFLSSNRTSPMRVQVPFVPFEN